MATTNAHRVEAMAQNRQEEMYFLRGVRNELNNYASVVDWLVEALGAGDVVTIDASMIMERGDAYIMMRRHRGLQFVFNDKILKLSDMASEGEK